MQDDQMSLTQSQRSSYGKQQKIQSAFNRNESNIPPQSKDLFSCDVKTLTLQSQSQVSRKLMNQYAKLSIDETNMKKQDLKNLDKLDTD